MSEWNEGDKERMVRILELQEEMIKRLQKATRDIDERIKILESK